MIQHLLVAPVKRVREPHDRFTQEVERPEELKPLWENRVILKSLLLRQLGKVFIQRSFAETIGNGGVVAHEPNQVHRVPP